MRDADGTIERLLAGLRDAEPPGGMERRILEAIDGMEASETAASVSLWRWPLRPAIAMLSACAVLLVVAIAVQQHRHAPPVLKSTEVQQPAKPKMVTQKAPILRLPTTSRVQMKPSQVVTAIPEIHPASFPAKPLPLTEQEKLLLRVAHRGDADNMAMLNPDLRTAQSVKVTEQFQQFFAIDSTEMRSQSE